MSETGPNVLVVAGDTDCWSVQHRSVDIGVDSRLRSVRKNFSAGLWRTVCGAELRAATALARYAEFFITNIQATDACFVGVCLSGAEAAASGTFLGGVAGTCAYRSINGPGGEIRLNGAIVQSGLASYTTGDTIGVQLVLVGGAPTLQFYKNGVAVGTPLTLTAGAYRLAASSHAVGWEIALNVDRDDMLFLPSTAQPWGAAARVADAGGYSPAAAVLNASRVSGAGLTLDSYLRAVTGVADGNWRTVCADRVLPVATQRQLRYFEVLIEVAGTSTHVGLQLAAPAAIGAFAGSTANSWGYSSSGGGTWHNGAANNVGAIAGNVAGTRIGVVWDCVSSVWIYVNGVQVGSGDPVTNTGARYSNLTGALEPCISQLGTAVGRARLCTHASEQLYRPVFAEAWDGADVLPEKHFAGMLRGDTSMRMSIWLPVPFGPGNDQGAPIGSVDLSNDRGRYYALENYDLRNQALSIYEMLPDAPITHFARGLCDHIQAEGDRVIRIMARGNDAFLDKRTTTELVTVGRTAYIPTYPVPNFPSTYRVADTPFVEFTVLDQGLAVTSWRRATTSACEAGFKRTVAVAGKQAARDAITYRSLGTIALTNGALTWSGGVLTGWAINHNGGTSLVSQNGSATRMQRAAGAPTCRISQAANPAAGASSIFVRFTVSVFTSGGVTISHTAGGSVNVPLGEPGTFWVRVLAVGAGSVQIDANDSTDVTINDVEIHSTTTTESNWLGPAYVIETLAGRPASSWTTHNALPLSQTYGYWSNQRPLLREILDRLMQALNADYYTSPSGILTLVDMPAFPLTNPRMVLTDSMALGEMDMDDLLAPSLSSLAQSSYNYDIHRNPDDIAGAVTDAERKALMEEFTVRAMSQVLDGNLHSFYEHAQNATPMPRLTYKVAPASTDFPLSALNLMFKNRLRLYKRRYGVRHVRHLRPGYVVALQSTTHNLGAGKNVVVMDMDRRAQGAGIDMLFLG